MRNIYTPEELERLAKTPIKKAVEDARFAKVGETFIQRLRTYPSGLGDQVRYMREFKGKGGLYKPLTRLGDFLPHGLDIGGRAVQAYSPNDKSLTMDRTGEAITYNHDREPYPGEVEDKAEYLMETSSIPEDEDPNAYDLDHYKDKALHDIHNQKMSANRTKEAAKRIAGKEALPDGMFPTEAEIQAEQAETKNPAGKYTTSIKESDYTPGNMPTFKSMMGRK